MKLFVFVALLLVGVSTAQLDSTPEPRPECPPEVSAECPAEDPPIPVHLPDPESCADFCECVAGTAHRVPCMPGLFFDAETGGCDEPDNVDCGERPTPPPEQ